MMKWNLSLLAVLLVPPLAAEGQVTYCRDIGDNKTYCSGGTVIHRFDKMTVIPNVAPAQPYPPAMPPNPLLQNNALPTLNAPYTAAGTQQALPAPMIQLVPDAPHAPVIVMPPGRGRICHQFGTTLVCN
jgi:hypothetical protein